MKNTLKKALQFVGGGGDKSSFNLANHLTGSGVMGASVLVPGENNNSNSRRSSLPVNIATGSHTLPYHSASKSSSCSPPSFVIPRIQVSYWNNNNSKVPPPPPSRAPPIPAESRPNRPLRNSSSPSAANR